MKTVRFADVVKAGGAPETYVLWTPAKQDPRFQSALKAHRVVTVQQDIIGSKKDFGEVGYHEQPNAQFLIFPKSVQRFADRRIIGMNYDLLAKESSPPKPSKKREAQSDKKKPRKIAESVAKLPKAEPAVEVPGKRSEVKPAKKEEAAAQPIPPKAQSTPVEKIAELPTPNPKSKTYDAADIRKAVERAMKELKAGKSVAAYERLGALAESLQ